MEKKTVFFDELVTLSKKYKTLMTALAACESRTLKALAVGHASYTQTDLSDDELAQIAGLEAAQKSLGSLPGDMSAAIKGLDKQIAQIRGDKAEKAWKAYRSVLSASGSSGKSTSVRDAYEGVVVQCSFGGGVVYHVAAKNAETYTVWKNTEIPEVKEIVVLPDFLEGYTLSSLTSHRKLTWAIQNGKTPTLCKDGIGTRKDGVDGGTLAQIVSHDPAAWQTTQRQKNSAKTPKA